MKFEQIRNATIRIEYAGYTFLIDPWLAPQYMTGSFNLLKQMCKIHRFLKIQETKYLIDQCTDMEVLNPIKSMKLMPLSKLPKPAKEINRGVDAYLISHIHPDHVGICLTGKICGGCDPNIPVYAQNKRDAKYLAYSGMKKVRCIQDKVKIADIEIIKTKAVHGTLIPCGDACGYIFKSPRERTLYIAGDTVWCQDVQEILNQYQPDVIVCNVCAAELKKYGRLIMDDLDLYKVYKTCPQACIIASHMDTVAHATLTRKTLKERLRKLGIADKILIPNDGDTIIFI